jgi:type III pantothenate kinase
LLHACFAVLIRNSLPRHYIIISLQLRIPGDLMAWLSLLIGNSRLHWAWWQNSQLQATWHSTYVAPQAGLDLLGGPQSLKKFLGDRPWQDLPLYLASVVPAQTAHWQSQARAIITLDLIPLGNLYPTLGIDRALAAYGAGERYGYPVLAIDGGTAITLTGIDDRRNLVGGAIWPGLSLQLRALAEGTGLLPNLTWEDGADSLPRWSRETVGAIRSGILHSTWAGLADFVADWRRSFPHSQLVITGGDSELLARGWPAASVTQDPNLAWWGMEQIVQSNFPET